MTAVKNKPLAVASVNATGTKGLVTIAVDGLSVTYNPNGQFESLGAGATASDLFSYVASDGKAQRQRPRDGDRDRRRRCADGGR